MTNSTPTAGGILTACAATVGGAVLMKQIFGRDSSNSHEEIPAFLSDPANVPIVEILKEEIDSLTGDSLVKICRQLDFWITRDGSRSQEALVGLTKRLVHEAKWRTREFQVPKARFGKTELQMPIITCGSMRFQHTWLPDFLPVAPSKKTVLNSPSQENLTHIVRECLKLGINHFETARMYGTSEMQLMKALSSMIESGEIKRSDFILQTKISPGPLDKFTATFEQSWKIFESLGYIDLLSFWCVSKDNQVEMSLAEGDDSIMAAALKWKEEGKIKHIGFSTHGTSENIMKMIESNKFEYVNLHYHYFGSYHAEGTPDSKGGHGNLACVKRALELDMGVFNISPIDKGGRLYQPSTKVAKAIGTEMSPIAFALLSSWMTHKMHTVSIGLARPEDLSEALEAANLYVKAKEGKRLLDNALKNLDDLAKKSLGEEWFEKGMDNVPGPFDPRTKGMGLGHMLWCSNMLNAYGMYEVAERRYKNLLSEGKKWNPKKSDQENIDAISGGNPMRAWVQDDKTVDLSVVLKNHYDPSLAETRIREVHDLFHPKSSKKTKVDADYLRARGWDEAYDLRPWNEFPNTDNATPTSVMLHSFSGGWLYKNGPKSSKPDDDARLKAAIVEASSKN